MRATEKLLIAVAIALGFMYWLAMDKVSNISKENQSLTEQLSEQIKINNGYQARIAKLNELDNKHTTELTNAKAEIDRLRDISDRNPERVYIKAECPKVSATSSTSLVDANTARPTDTAIRNYWVLRERIAQSEQVIKGLQDYIKTECIN